MTMEVEEAFPSFSTERIRSKIHMREAPAIQRRLDYNAPLLSVRRLADAGGDVRSKLWKLSAELSKEPLSIRGAVPFTWEHSPGRPKQPEGSPGEVASVSRASESPPTPPKSPPRSPSSPSPPSTPSPPSSRRASPASPPLPSPPALRPRFIRSNSSTLYAPPPPPPPPPPPVPFMPPPFRIRRRSAPRTEHPLPSSSLLPHPPSPPPLPPPAIQASKSTAHDRVKAFRLFDPTEDLLRALRARREKLEALEEQCEATGLVSETPKTDTICNEPIDEVAKTRCGVVDAIVQRFLADHPDASVEEEAFRDRHDGQTQQGDDQGILDAAKCSGLARTGSIDDDAAAQHCNHEASNDIPLQEDVPALQVCFNEAADEEAEMQRPVLLDRSNSGAFEEGKPEPVAVCASAKPSIEAVEVQLETGDKQVSLIKKQPNKRRSNSIAILDSCRVESLRMIKSALVQLCRKAAAASLRTLGKAKRRVTPCHRNSSSLEVVVHRDASAAPSRSSSNLNEKAVVREVEVIPQERLSQSEQQVKVQMHPVIPVSPPKISADMQVEAMELHQGTPISSPMSESKETQDTISSPPPHTALSMAGSLDLQATIEITSFFKSRPDTPPPNTDNSIRRESSDLQPTTLQAETHEPRTYSVRHAYTKSLGGDESNEFYDASSRFGSQSSTPSRIHSGRSMSKDWGHSDDFLDATSTPFESPRTSMSENRYSGSPSITSKVGSSNRPTSQLSKRVGKALWVDTREINATGKASGLCSIPMKNFYSGELFTTSNESSSALSKEEPLCTRRKWVSGDQASTSTSVQARRQNKRGGSSSQNGKNAIAVTPVYPSKCQKNRMIGSASGLPRQILAEDMKDVGWPLGISGYPPLKTSAKEKAESKLTKKELSSGVVPSPPLPPSPAGGSWLRKALTTSTLNQAPSRLAGLHATAKKTPSSPTPNSPNKKWEDIVKGSHVQPGHLRFSEELHHHPPNSSSNKYYIS